MPDHPNGTDSLSPPSHPVERRLNRLTLIEWLVVASIIAVLISLQMPGVQSSGNGGVAREACQSKLKEIAFALYQYHRVYGSFPPAFVADEQGRPMHSWRVLILPYLDGGAHQKIYNQYRFDEPWDGPHNKLLADTPIPAFNCPLDHRRDSKEPDTRTSYLAVVGMNTAWRGTIPVKLKDITDGAADTLHVVEAHNSGIKWAEPRDLTLAEMAVTINAQSPIGISSRHKHTAHAAFSDSAVRSLSEFLPAPTLRALLTRNGGEKLADGDW